MKDRNKRRKFNRNYRGTFHVGKYALGFVIISIVFVSSLLYLSQSNKMALRGYDIASLQQQKQELLDQQERLQIEASRLQSIQKIQDGLKDSGMVPVKKINYIPENTSIALNR